MPYARICHFLVRSHHDAAMKLGATKEQIVETILQLMFYAGGAAVANAPAVANEVFKSNADA